MARTAATVALTTNANDLQIAASSILNTNVVK